MGGQCIVANKIFPNQSGTPCMYIDLYNFVGLNLYFLWKNNNYINVMIIIFRTTEREFIFEYVNA